jgi:hypothetical protein
MQLDSCLVYYECKKCGYIMRPKDGDCCVFCSYADKKCPPMQVNLNELKSIMEKFVIVQNAI